MIGSLGSSGIPSVLSVTVGQVHARVHTQPSEFAPSSRSNQHQLDIRAEGPGRSPTRYFCPEFLISREVTLKAAPPLKLSTASPTEVCNAIEDSN